MAKKPRRAPPAASRVDLARLEQALAACLERLAQLEHAVEINIKRIAAMQADIDQLRGHRPT